MADKGTRAARVLMVHQGVPNQALRVGVDPHQRQLAQLPDLSGHIVRWRHRVREHPCPAPPGAVASWRGERNMTGAVEHAQRLGAACALQPPAPVAQMECITDVIGDLPQARDPLRCRTVQHIVKSGNGDKALPTG